METTFRRAAETDVPAILPLWRELMEFHADLDPQIRLAADATAQAETHLRAQLALPASLCAVAEHDDALVGYCRASVRQQAPVFEPRAHGFISEFYVRASFRRGGVGRGLFEYVRRWLVEQNIHRVELVTLNANRTSRAFWRGVGCEPCRERHFLEFPAS